MAFQGDWRVQAVHKTFNLIVGQELAETAYDADGNPITVTQTKEGSEEQIEVETTTNKIQPFKFESKISSGRFRGADWTYLAGAYNHHSNTWSTVGHTYPLLKTPLRMSVVDTRVIESGSVGVDEYDPLPKGLKIVQGEDLESAYDIPYVTGVPTEEGEFEITFKIWSPNETVEAPYQWRDEGNGPLEANSADSSKSEITFHAGLIGDSHKSTSSAI